MSKYKKLHADNDICFKCENLKIFNNGVVRCFIINKYFGLASTIKEDRIIKGNDKVIIKKKTISFDHQTIKSLAKSFDNCPYYTELVVAGYLR